MYCVRTRLSPPTRTLRGERFWPVSRALGIFKANAALDRLALDVDAGLRSSRRSNANARLCRNARGRDAGGCQELAARVILQAR